MLAYLMLDGPGLPQEQLRLCVFLPTFVTTLAWGLIKWKKWLAIPSLVFAVLGVFIVGADALHPSTRNSMIEDFGISYVFAILLSATFPFLAIAVFYFEAKKKPNQSLQPTPGMRSFRILSRSPAWLTSDR